MIRLARFLTMLLALSLPAAAAADMQVTCRLSPTMIPEGGVSTIILEVDSGGEPVEGATVRVESFVEGSSFAGSGEQTTGGTTGADGVFRDEWKALQRSPHRYMGAGFAYEVEKEGLGKVSNRCALMVQQVEDRSSAIAIHEEKRRLEAEQAAPADE